MSAVEQRAPSGEMGRPRTRVEDPRLVAGQGRYVEDIQLPGMVHMVLVRSPYPHARIVRVNAEAARAASGVRLVLVGADVPPIARLPVAAIAPELKVPPYEPLCATVARAVGMPVAAVIADERSAAFDAAALVDVEYEPLDGVADPEAALADGAPLLYPEFGTNACYTLPLSRGDVDAAFAAAAHTTTLRIAFPRLAPAPLEPRGVLAQFDRPTGDLTVWATTQSPNRVRAIVSLALGLSDANVRVIAPEMGGGFGSRGAVYQEYVIAAWASRRLGRPVRWIATRSEDVATTTHGRDQVIYIEAATDAEGRLTALRGRIFSNLGGFLHVNTLTPAPLILKMLPGCYRVPAYSGLLSGVFTNTNPPGPYRGAGRPEAAGATQRPLDHPAPERALPPGALARRH